MINEGTERPAFYPLHFRALLMTLVTLSAYLNPAALVSIFGLFTMQNQYFPYALLAIDLFVGGTSAALHALTGLIAGYVWWWVVHSPQAHAHARQVGRAGSWQRYAEAPGLFRRVVGDGARRARVGEQREPLQLRQTMRVLQRDVQAPQSEMRHTDGAPVDALGMILEA